MGRRATETKTEAPDGQTISAPKGTGGMVWCVFKDREGYPAVPMTESIAAIYEKRGAVKIVGNKYAAQEESDRLKAVHADEKPDDGIKDLHL